MVQNGCSPATVTLLLYVLLAVSLSASAQPIEIVNRHGAVGVEVVADNLLQATRLGASPGTTEGLAISRSPARLLIEALPPENQSPDIELRIPLGVSFSVTTEDGDISLTGMVRSATVQSLRGSLAIDAPLEVTTLNLESTERPRSIALPDRLKASFVPVSIHPRLRVWRLSRSLRPRDLRYGSISGQLYSPAKVMVRDWEIPRNWPLKPHTLSRNAVGRLLEQAERRREHGTLPPAPPPSDAGPERDWSGPAGTVVFKSEVRMVNMSVAVSDSGGRPMTGLQKENFLVEEDGALQDVRVVDPEESPFNMAILLDLSGSTAIDLEHMRQATLKLIQMAGPRDRVSLYAMSGSMFYRLASLTADHEALVERCKSLPYPSGGSPLWDTIVLVYDDELAERDGERNALIVISDGIDNRISGQSVPSTLRATRLIDAASEMDARIYPIFLLSGERFGRNWSPKARGRMESLARKTGGRLFTARSVADIEPVLPELAREMRSVYDIAYYPDNQEFDGGWRRVRIKVNLPGAQVRARPGYFAE